MLSDTEKMAAGTSIFTMLCATGMEPDNGAIIIGGIVAAETFGDQITEQMLYAQSINFQTMPGSAEETFQNALRGVGAGSSLLVRQQIAAAVFACFHSTFKQGRISGDPMRSAHARANEIFAQLFSDPQEREAQRPPLEAMAPELWKRCVERARAMRSAD